MFIRKKTVEIAQKSILQLSPELQAVQKSAKEILNKNLSDLEALTAKIPEIQANQNELIKSLEKLAQSARYIK